MKYTYTQQGRQEPIFFMENSPIHFWIEGEQLETVKIQMSYDPVYVGPRQRVWEDFSGGMAAVFKAPPTALRVVIQQASKPVFLWVNKEAALAQ